MLTELRAWIAGNFSISTETQNRLLMSLAVIVGIWVIKWLIVRLVMRRTQNVTVIYNWRKSSDYMALFLVVLIVGRIWFTGFDSAATYFGLLSAGLAISLQDLIANFVGWAFIVTRRPFEVGDRIEVGDHAGDVVDVRFFQFTLLEIRGWVDADQSTGRLLHMPNRLVFSHPIASFTKGLSYLWYEIAVEVTFESDWEKAKRLLKEIVDENTLQVDDKARERLRSATRRYQIYYNTFTPIVYTRVTPSGVLLTMRFLAEPRGRRRAEEQIWEAVLRTFAKHEDIEFAYPTQRVYYRPGDEAYAAERPPHDAPDRRRP